MPPATEQEVLDLINEDTVRKFKNWKPSKETDRLGKRLIGL